MRKVGVTGGAGFIGMYVCETLLESGYEVVIMDHHNYNIPIPASHDANIEVFLGDVRDAIAVREFAAHVDGVIHLAAILGTQENTFNPIPSAETNTLGGLNLLQSVAEYKIPMSYIAVGNWWHHNPYSISKFMVERYIQMFNQDRGTTVNIVRAMNAYGPRQLAAAPFGPGKVRKISPSFICRALSGMPIEIYGDGLQISDMVYVKDVALALVLALQEAADGKVFDRPLEIGDGAKTTVLETAQLVKELCEADVDIIHLPMRPGEVPGAVVSADTSTLSLVGLTVDDLYPLQDGMQKTVQYFKDTKGITWHAP